MRSANTTETRIRGKVRRPTCRRHEGSDWRDAPGCRPSIGAVVFVLVVFALTGVTGCGPGPWNDPYPGGQADSNTVYSSFDERPKHLDPVRSYSANEYAFLAQIYEPPLQYHLLMRPYRLVPLSAAEVPIPRYFDEDGAPLPADAPAAIVGFDVE